MKKLTLKDDDVPQRVDLIIVVDYQHAIDIYSIPREVVYEYLLVNMLH